MSAEPTSISIRPSTLPRILSVLAILLLIASTMGEVSRFVFDHDYVKGLVPLFNVNAELNIPTYLSVLLMLTIAFLLAVIAYVESNMTHSTWQWVLLSIGFVFIGYDEAFSVHERLVEPVRRILGTGNLGVFYYAWVVPAIALVFILFLVFFKFLIQLPAPTRKRFILAAAIYLGGCIGMELIGGWIRELQHGLYTWQYAIAVTIEEGMEMAGLIVFIYALLKRFEESGTAIVVRFATR